MNFNLSYVKEGFLGSAIGKEPACQCRRHKGLVPGSERSSGGGHGKPLQYSCLENPMDRGSWQAPVYRYTELDTAEVTLCTYVKYFIYFCIIGKYSKNVNF